MPPELRSSIRLPTPEGREAAVLRFDGKAIACRLMNESCGGFGIRAPKDAPVFVGMLAALGAGGGWHQVKVAHVHSEGDDLVVGLQRQGELPNDWHLRERKGVWTPGRRAAAGPGWASWATGALFVLGLLIALAVWQWGGDSALRSGSDKFSQAASGTVSAAASTVEAAAETAAETARQVAFSPAYLPDVGVLAQPGAADALELTAEQRSAIAAIVSRRDEALRKVYGQATAGGIQALQLEVAWKQQAAARQVWDVLSEAQREKIAESQKKRPR